MTKKQSSKAKLFFIGKKTVGHCGFLAVDSGSVVLGDFINKVETDKDSLKSLTETGIARIGDRGGFSRGVIIESGIGDGIYPVFVEVDKKTNRISAVRIEFDPMASLDDDVLEFLRTKHTK